LCCFFFQAEDGIRDDLVTGVQTCALPISYRRPAPADRSREVFGRGPQALAACKEAYAALKQGAVTQAQQLVAAWPARNEWAAKQIGRASCRERGEVWRGEEVEKRRHVQER